MTDSDRWLVRRIPHPDAPELSELVDDVDAFIGEVAFRRPQLSRVAALGRFGEVEVLWDDLLRRGTRQPAFRVVRGGATLPAAEVTRQAGIGNRDLDDLVAANDVVERYRRGDTVVLQGLHHTDPHMAKLANNLALALDHPVQVNAYLSPAGARGLDLHFDFHDVFVVQLGGAKRWRVWAPLPRTTDPVKGRHTILPPRLDELGDALLDVTMCPGDCLYLPRGYPHAAETVEEHSDHLTIGVVAVTWQRVVRKTIDAEVAAGRLSGALPIGLLASGVSALDPGGEPLAAAGVADVGRLVTAATLRQWMAREVWRRQPSTRLRPRVVPDVGTGPLVLTPGPLLWLTVVADRAVLGLGDRLLDLPVEGHDLLAAVLRTSGTFRPDDLGELDDDSRRVVLHRLLAEGVLVHAGDQGRRAVSADHAG